MIDFLKKIFLGSDSVTAKHDNEQLTNERIKKMLVNNFEQEIKRRSVGKRMIYPMSFTIVMHHEDYQQHCDDFHLFMGEVVDDFYGVIRKYKNKYPNYINPAKYWKFRFIPSMFDKMEMDDKEVNVVKGNPFILCSIFDVIEGKTSAGSIQVSVTVGKSQAIRDVNVNLAAFENFNLREEPVIIYWKDPFGKPTPPQPQAGEALIGNTQEKQDKPHEEQKPVEGTKLFSPSFDIPFHDPTKVTTSQPKLAYKLNGEIYSHTIKSDECYICGKSSKGENAETFKAMSDQVSNPHVLIRKDKEQNVWLIAAFEQTHLGDKVLETSNPSNPIWTTISQSENISMNGFVVRIMIDN